MEDSERTNALREEAEALDRQLVDYVVDKLAAKKLGGGVELSDSVREQIDTAFAQAAEAQGATVGAAIAKGGQSLVDAIDQHKQLLLQSGANPAETPARTGQSSSIRASVGSGAKAQGNASSGLMRIVLWVGGLIALGTIAVLSWLLLSRQPDTGPSCAQVIEARSELAGVIQSLDQASSSERFQSALQEGLEPVEAPDNEELPPLSFESTLAQELQRTNDRLRSLDVTLADACGTGELLSVSVN